MVHHVFWTPWEGYGLEHLYLSETTEGVVADGLILGAATGSPFRIQYTLSCDVHWNVRQLDMYSLGEEALALHLRSNGTGLWTTETGHPLPHLDGCLDLDISATPFTNTLPIRRLALQVGDSRDLQMIYIAAGDCTVTLLKQRYTCLERRADGALYSVEGSYISEETLRQFRAELHVDVHGLVIDYPALFRRIQR